MVTSLDRHSKTLELDKILALLKEKISVEATGELIDSLSPSFDIDEVRERLARTDDAYRLVSYFKSPSFGCVRDMTSSLRRAQSGGVLSMKELLDIAEILRVSRSLKEWRERCEGCEANHLDENFELLYINKYLEERISFCIKSEEEMNDNASPELASIRRKIRSCGASVRDKLDKLIHSSSSKYLQDAIVTQRDGRFVVPVKSEYRSEVSGLVHDTSASGATLFIEPAAVVELNNEIRVLQTKEKDEIERILAELSAEAAEFSDSIILSFGLILELDLAFAKAELAFDMKASMPKISERGIVRLKNARHPLIPKSRVVPISVEIGRDCDTLVITGPNTGGKTVTLKTIGLLEMMTLCGLMIPADDGSEIVVFDHILADIGDEQSIEQDFSTFSAHMTNIVSILNTATCDSLVLIDELGAGTDPIEGAALATAILMKLRENGVMTVATTHYAELKSYALETDRVLNASCEFDVETLRPTYRLIIGAPGRSNAFAISKRIGLSDDIINTASGLVSEKDTRFEKVISVLDTARREAEEEKRESEKLRIDLENMRKKHSSMQTELEKERKAIIQKARDEARSIVERTRNKSDALLSELEVLRKDSQMSASERVRRARESIKSGMRDAENTADPIEKRAKAIPLPRKLVVGDTVEIVDIDKRATVLEAPKDNGTVLVLAGIIRTTVPLDNLRLVEEKKTAITDHEGKRRKTVTTNVVKSERNAAIELDLRGMNSDEAIMELDRYIDNAVLGGITSFTVIHGKGTGVLRKSVHEYLRSHRQVKSFRLGLFGEGENGVTVVDLK